MSREIAATAAISSPIYLTLSMANTVSSYRAGLTPYLMCPACSWVITDLTPGSLAAFDVLMESIFAWAWGL